MISKHQFETSNTLIQNGIYDTVIIRQATGLTSTEVEDLITNYQMYKSMYIKPESDSPTFEQPKVRWISNIKNKFRK